VAALITDMDQPLGRTAGNALEVMECIETLKGRGPTDLESLSVELAAWMVHLAGAAASLDAARTRVRAALASGAGLERLRRVIELQGGNPRVCDDPSLLPQARETVVVRSDRDGRLVRLAARAIGHAGMLLGAGRETLDSPIDPAVGFVFHKKVGDPVAVGEAIATVHVGKASRAEAALARLRDAIAVGPEAPARGPLILDILT
jgi:pyrimidine-nucleoside phosphorylase